ncbi:MAG: FAD-dependent oxidoreductase, partial [Ferruginibacter sp.]
MKNILISGAGVGGPALAYWLHRYNYNVTIVEKASAVRKGGYRIDIRGAAVTVVDQMGLLEAIRENATAMLGSSFVNRNGKRTINLDNPDLFGMREKQDVEIMRGDLVDILYRSTKEYTSYVFDESITGISHIVNGVEVTFQNGITKTYDL